MLKPSEILQQRGWVQGASKGPKGQVCLGQAINIATPMEWSDRPLRDRLRYSVLQFFENVHKPQCSQGHSGISVSAYNDCKQMDFDTILRAAKHAEQEVGL